MALEITWTVIPTLICAVIFVWASSLYFRNSRPPNASMEIFVVGKQWMWHMQHPEGPREINELHVPVGVPVKLTMTSEDVIHDFSIPAFRIKKDVLPGRYSSIWFQATKIGTYHFFCAQYCGADHSGMIGWVYVMTPTDYAHGWAAARATNRWRRPASGCSRSWAASLATWRMARAAGRSLAGTLRASGETAERRNEDGG